MYDDALAWAGSSMGSLVSSEPLHGGVTSPMLALRHDAGTESVLRLMIDEPWRTHGAGCSTRERASCSSSHRRVPAPVTLALDAEDGRAASRHT